MQVTDEEGRRRFHGAFTGGFSAGYFNSVGSKEGWQPTTFSSSRQERGRMQQRRAEDFMDEDDDPLLGKRLETTAQYDTLQSGARRRQQQQQQQDAPRNAFEAHALNSNRQSAVSAYPTMNFLDELVRPVNDSIGAKLLNRMGWKEGHGIGPRIRKKKITDSDQQQAPDTDKHGKASSSRRHEVDETATEDEVVYIPPRNTIDVSAFPKPKLDKYGAGFDPYVNAPEFSRYKQHRETALTQKEQQRQVVTFADAMKATSGSYETVTAFGLSALEDNDDLDVYGMTSMNEFDTAIGPARLTNGEEVKLIDSEARESHSHGEKKQRRAPTFGSDGRPALPGFELAYVKEKPPKAVALRLEVPADFKPFHHFDNDNDELADPTAALYQKHNFSTGKYGQGSLITAKQRAALLAEPQAQKAAETMTSADVNGAHNGSVFDLLGPEQKAKLFAAAAQAKANSTMKSTTRDVVPPRREPVERQPLVGGAAETQFRANISASIAKRFVSATSSTEQQGDTEQSLVAQAPIITHKPSYRSESLWIPKSLLCKRFHVKCLVGTRADRDGALAEDEKRDLFDKELVPHLVEFAAERQSVNRERSSTTGAKNGVFTAMGAPPRSAKRNAAGEKEEEDELPPLPIVEKPAASLLKSIFEPSDESAVEEDEEEEDLDDYEESDEEKADHAIGSLDTRVSQLGDQNSLTTGTVPPRSVKSSGDDDDRAVVAGGKWNGTQQRTAVSSRGDRDRAASSSDESGLSSDLEQSAPRSSATKDPTAHQPHQVTRGNEDESDSSDTDRKKKKKKKSKSSSKKHKKKHHRSSSRHHEKDSDDDDSDDQDARKHRKKRKESKKKPSSSSSSKKTKRGRSESRDRSEAKRSSSNSSKHRRHH